MVYYMPGETTLARAGQGPADREAGAAVRAEDLTPRQIVAELDRYIVGQGRAKRAVAIALRNRYRRLRLPPSMADEVAPKNIIMIGPTGVGKTEIARRLARLARSPFMKVEATKFTEVGYVGRDVESIVRDLTEIAIGLVRQEERAAVRGRAQANVEERLAQLLIPQGAPAQPAPGETEGAARARADRVRETMRQQLHEGLLENAPVEVDVQGGSGMPFQIFTPQGMEEINFNLKEMMPGLFPGRPRRRRMTVAEARPHLLKEEEDKLVDMDGVTREAIARVEQSGIVFLDEIDKITAAEGGRSGPDVSRQGVQRDLLPIIEGTTVNTKYGMVRTDHILFIASGAFHASKPSDLMPELQGRFPIRVELDALTRDDFVRILSEPENALVKQYIALMKTEEVALEFTSDGVEALADFSVMVNERTENIGARRLHTIIETVLDDVLFDGTDGAVRSVRIDAAYVRGKLSGVAADQDLSRYIL